EFVIEQCVARDVGQRRVEPSAAACAQDFNSHFALVVPQEHLDGLGEVHDARDPWNSLAFESLWMPLPVPVFIERLDRERRSFGKTEATGDVATAFASRC